MYEALVESADADIPADAEAAPTIEDLEKAASNNQVRLLMKKDDGWKRVTSKTDPASYARYLRAIVPDGSAHLSGLVPQSWLMLTYKSYNAPSV